MKKIRVGILFGGRSTEHEISLQSAKNVIANLDRKKYLPILIKIDKSGKWLFNNREQVVLVPPKKGAILSLARSKFMIRVDVVFPVLHGSFGEDGTIQGLLKLANIPFVGASVLGSAIGIDKDVTKRLLKEAGVMVARFLVFKGAIEPDFKLIVKRLGLPFFIKPASLGSSVGINKVKNKREFLKAITDAFRYDRKILAEEYIEGREIECSVLGNDNPIASVPGEVVVNDEFYSYKAKYLDKKGARLEIPAKISTVLKKKIQNLAIKTFKILCCEGMARIDFFLKKNGQILVNEINTIPGFTAISMYPKLWQASGIGYKELIDKLIQLAVERFNKEQKLKTSYSKIKH